MPDWSHRPPGYTCPFCEFLAGRDRVNDQRDVVRRTERATAFVAPRWWPNNPGHVLVIPNEHYENLYDLPAAYGHAVHDVVQEVAVAMRAAYGCAGISTRQHNEPAGNQDVWHLHVHVFPRHDGDDLYRSRARPGFVPQTEREPYARRLQDYFAGRVESRIQAR
ncbi:MAG: HIT family protein [Hamadaea sp.]|nr:HIT family protein [Hamadaea sp.]